GDCVVAAIGHMVELWTFDASAGKSTNIPSDAQILAMYEAVGGYVPGNPATDQGATLEAGLAYLVTHGLNGVHAVAWPAVPTGDHQMVKQAVNLFGAMDY